MGIESSGAGVFEPVGAGGHYLQVGSPHRNVGMNGGDWPAGYSINRHERDRFNAWQPAIWNQ